MEDHVKDRFESLPLFEEAFRVLCRHWDLSEFMYQVDQMDSERSSIADVAMWRVIKEMLLKMDMSNEKPFLVEYHQQYIKDGTYDILEKSSVMEGYAAFRKKHPMTLEELMADVAKYEEFLAEEKESGEYDDRGNYKFAMSLREEFAKNFPDVELPKVLRFPTE